MADLDKIRVIKNGVTTDYEVGGSGGTPSEVELPIDYSSVYDTEEHQAGWYKVTGGYKPLYRKVLYLTVDIAASVTSTTIQLPLSNIEAIWLIDKSTYINQDDYELPFPYINGDGMDNTIGYYSYINNGVPEIRVRKGTGQRLKNEIFVVEYTKTTDTIVTEIPKETIPAVVQKESEIYSLDEQVIGQWIDGKPLYRKTINFGALPSLDNEKSVSTNVSNIDVMINVYGFSTNGDGYFSINDDYIAGIGCIYSKNTNQIKIQASRNRTDYTTTYVTIEYTKTTDTVGGAE